MGAAHLDPEPPASDEALVDQLLAGDREAFNHLYERYLPRIYAFVDRRLSNAADIEETVQEVFVNVFSSIHTFRGEAPFAAWVFGLARRTIASRFKKRRHATVPLHHDDGHPSAPRDADPFEAYQCKERVERIRQAAQQDLTPEQRELFRLHHLQHRPIREIAQALQKSEDSIKSHLYRARKVLLGR